MTVALAALSSGSGIDLVRDLLFKLTPKTDKQRWLHARALETHQRDRSIPLDHRGADRQPVSLGPLDGGRGWLTIIFASFGLFAPRTASVTAVLFVAALALAGAIFMILNGSAL